MPLALIASAGTTANEYLARHVAELGYPRPVIVASGGEARRRLGEKDFAVVVINTPLPDEFGHELGVCAVEKSHAGVLLLAKAGTAEQIAPKLQEHGVLVLSKPFSGAQFRQAVQMAASCSRRLALLLEENARLSVEDLAAMLSSTPEEVAAKMDEYTKTGVIRGYKALVDWEKLNADRVKAVIELRVRPKKSHGFDEIASAIACFDEVQSVLLMSGGYDLQLILTGHSFQEIALFVAKRLAPMDDVLSTATHFVLRTYKKDGVLYADEETDEREWATL